ncbi:hypothetical protein LTR27_008169 [Elasticomyces elasticus]|nr:hypothetical protein LTR27_008169 [Elasticomyces elasticus]
MRPQHDVTQPSPAPSSLAVMLGTRLELPNGQRFGSVVSDSSNNQQEVVRTPKQPSQQRALHYCAHGCCARLHFEAYLPQTNDPAHLPVCHASCWQKQKDYLVRGTGYSELQTELPLCHRHCYLEAQHLDKLPKKVVPAMRTMGEMFLPLKCQWSKDQKLRMEEAVQREWKSEE